MRFTHDRSGDSVHAERGLIEVTDLEALLSLAKQSGYPLIVTIDPAYPHGEVAGHIEVYDGFRE